MDEYGGLTKYAKRPKRENEKLHVVNGSARVHFSSHSGSFKGSMSHILFINAQNISGTQKRGRSSKFVDYICDEKKALSIYGDKEQAKKAFKDIEDELLPRRKNAVIQRRFVVQLPREFLNSPDKNLEKLCKTIDEKYFGVSKTFVAALHDGGNDFKNPHLHIVFANCDENYKNIREYNSKDFVNFIKKDIAQFIKQEIGVKCEVSATKKKSKHYPRWVSEAYKRAINDKSGKLIKEYSERYTSFAAYATEQNSKLYEKAIFNKENKIKKTAEAEISTVQTMTEKIKKKAGSWLYGKSQREEYKKDAENNEKYVEDVKKRVENLNFSEELARQEQERLAKIEKEQELKHELKKDIIINNNINNNEQKQENQDFGRDKNKEMQLDAFSQDLENRLNKSKGLGRGL